MAQYHCDKDVLVGIDPADHLASVGLSNCGCATSFLSSPLRARPAECSMGLDKQEASSVTTPQLAVCVGTPQGWSTGRFQGTGRAGRPERQTN